MFVGLALILAALLWAHRIRHDPDRAADGYRGPWIMGGVGLSVFVLYLWLVTDGMLGR